jgi:hypothetical protein
MPIKLNLSISEAAAKRIKLYAAKNNTSVSKMLRSNLISLLLSKKKRAKAL